MSELILLSLYALLFVLLPGDYFLRFGERWKLWKFTGILPRLALGLTFHGYGLLFFYVLMPTNAAPWFLSVHLVFFWLNRETLKPKRVVAGIFSLFTYHRLGAIGFSGLTLVLFYALTGQAVQDPLWSFQPNELEALSRVVSHQLQWPPTDFFFATNLTVAPFYLSELWGANLYWFSGIELQALYFRYQVLAAWMIIYFGFIGLVQIQKERHLLAWVLFFMWFFVAGAATPSRLVLLSQPRFAFGFGLLLLAINFLFHFRRHQDWGSFLVFCLLAPLVLLAQPLLILGLGLPPFFMGFYWIRQKRTWPPKSLAFALLLPLMVMAGLYTYGQGKNIGLPDIRVYLSGINPQASILVDRAVDLPNGALLNMKKNAAKLHRPGLVYLMLPFFLSVEALLLILSARAIKRPKPSGFFEPGQLALLVSSIAIYFVYIKVSLIPDPQVSDYHLVLFTFFFGLVAAAQFQAVASSWWQRNSVWLVVSLILLSFNQYLWRDLGHLRGEPVDGKPVLGWEEGLAEIKARTDRSKRFLHNQINAPGSHAWPILAQRASAATGDDSQWDSNPQKQLREKAEAILAGSLKGAAAAKLLEEWQVEALLISGPSPQDWQALGFSPVWDMASVTLWIKP